MGNLFCRSSLLEHCDDFAALIEWFATRADRILLLFDAHKLDISDEFRRSIEMLKGHDDKIRVVLNKSDRVSNQQLMRVYGAMMWSLGKVVRSPEVLRVYISSFWDKPYADVGASNKDLFEKIFWHTYVCISCHFEDTDTPKLPNIAQ